MSNSIHEGGKRMGRNFARIRAEAEKLIAENDRLKGEIDTLVAHMERLSELLERSQIGLDWYRDTYPEADSGADDEHAEAVRQAVEETSANPLPRTKERWKAEGATLVAERAWQRTQWDGIGNNPKEMAANHATQVANEIRRQAEGGE